MKKIGIMGGTFNPIHNGHIALAQAAYEYYALDEVWFIPCGVSYLKAHENIVSGRHRLEMTKLAIQNITYFRCSDIELCREGYTYTVDTLRFLHEKYPEDKFYFIIGADALCGLPKWRSPKEIAALCTLVSVVRDDVDKQELLEQKDVVENTLGAKVIMVPFQKVDISSRIIRNKISEGENVTKMLPTNVLEYIDANGLYKGANMEELRCTLKAKLGEERFEHTLGVAYTAACLAGLYGVDTDKALRAGMLHDCAKSFDSEKIFFLCQKYGIAVSDVEMRNPTALLHAKVGAKLAADEYYEKDENILNAIEYHTTGRPEMSMLEKIIFVADYIEPGRDKAPNLYEIRKLAFCDIESALVKILQDTLEYLSLKGIETDPATKRTLEYYDRQQ